MFSCGTPEFTMDEKQKQLQVSVHYEYSHYSTEDTDCRGMVTVTVPDKKLKCTPEIVLVVDSSGSMADNLKTVRAVIEYMMERFQNQARCAVVGFSNVATVYQNMTAVTPATRGDIMKNLYALVSDGCTNLADGLLTGLGLFTKGHFPRYVFLITDGFANAGIVDEVLIGQAVKDLDSKAQLYTLAIGEQCNEHLLASLAETTGGYFNKVTKAANLGSSMGGMIGAIYGTAVNKCLVSFPDFVINLSGRAETVDVLTGSMTVNLGSLLTGEEIHVPFQSTDKPITVQVHSQDTMLRGQPSVVMTSTIPISSTQTQPEVHVPVFVQLLRVEVAKALLAPEKQQVQALLEVCADPMLQEDPIVRLLQTRLEAALQGENMHLMAVDLIKQRSHTYDDEDDPMVLPILRSFSTGARNHCFDRLHQESEGFSPRLPTHDPLSLSPLVLKRL